ncbi:Dihydroxyacetone kinase [Hyphodiscus hymeniophilus]|uniref:Dihydroxyacetone kinase n=1 Tax=Hyphodiscus hymeniophilus TaxID=353542 RepID=A0A9P6VJF1_9HELO|nr:Dihydroxyacetone kinase [Hyphodiscus hymeniophilus]
MSLVVSQTLPYTPSELRLSDTKHWNRLLPLIRPSVKEKIAHSGHSILVDTALAKSKGVLISAIGHVDNFPSGLLNDSHIAAFGAESEVAPIPASDLVSVLKDSGFPIENGLVVIRPAPRPDLRVSEGLVEVDVEGDLKVDHILSLLGAAEAETKRPINRVKELLEHFVQSVTTTNSTFLQEKTGCGPSVNHAVEVAEFNSAKKAIDKDLGYILRSMSKIGTNVVYSVHFSDINGLSRLESNILAHEISEYLSNKSLPSYITQSTLLDSRSPGRGWAISLCPVPETCLTARPAPTNTLAASISHTPTTNSREDNSKIYFSDSQVRKIIVAGCESVIKDEPIITEYDTIVGDGDCGYTLRDGAKQVLSFIGTSDLSALPSTLSALVDDLEVNMGGTSGALYCIFLSSLAQELWTAPTFPEALNGALEHLLRYTRARLGDRTLLDCLIPFVETFKKTNDQRLALGVAEKGVESTKKLEAKMGRSSYLDEATTMGVPDPGAYGLFRLLEGMISAE